MNAGPSWALIAQSAMSMTGGAGGILSADIAALIEGGGIDSVFVFPDYTCAAGVYLWRGTFNPEDDDFTGPPAMPIDWSEVQGWIDRHGEAPEPNN